MIAVSVSVFNQLPTLMLFLESMKRQTVLPGVVIIADDGSTDSLYEWIKSVDSSQYPFVLRYCAQLHNGYGLSKVHNLASTFNPDCTRFMFTNADVVHCPDSVKAHAVLGPHTIGAGMVCGIAYPQSLSITLQTVVSFDSVVQLATSNPSPRSNRPYTSHTDPNTNPLGVWGGNFSVPSILFNEVKGFDEQFSGWGGEDADLVHRAVKVGGRVKWVLTSVVYHLDHPIQSYDRQGESMYVSRYLSRSLHNGAKLM